MKAKVRVDKNIITKTTHNVLVPDSPTVSYVGTLGTTVGMGATDGVEVGTSSDEVFDLKLSISKACMGSIILTINSSV